MRVFRIALYLLERIFCKHDYVFSHNIFGDEINAVDGDRSWWKCAVCGKWETKVSLVTTLYKGEVRE